MNILYTNFHRDEGGGHTTYIRNLLQNPLHEKFVACPEGSRLFTSLSGSGRVIPLAVPSRLSELPQIMASALRLKRIIERYRIDLVHTNGSADNRLALYASCLGGKKCKVLFTKHNTYAIKGAISRLRLRYFNDAVILVGPHVAREARMGEHSSYYVVEHGVDLAYWKRKTAPAAPKDSVHLVSNSGTSKHKGWQHMVEALEMLPEEKRARLKVTIVGRPNGALLQAEEKGLIRYAGLHADSRPFLEEADIGFVLSYHEASSFAAREMMAMGLPLVLSDFAGCEALDDPACAWKTQKGDSRSVMRALLQILSLSPGEILRMKTAARAKAEAEFGLERTFAKTNEIYERVLYG